MSLASLSARAETVTARVAVLVRRAFGRIRLHRYTSGSGFAVNLGFMLTGTIVGQVVSIALSPILTRIYGPEQFGFLSVYAATLTILGVAAALGFELAIPLTTSDNELADLFAVSVVALLGTTGLLGLAAWLIPTPVLNSLWLGPLSRYRLLLPIGFACFGGYYVMVSVATRIGAFRDIASTRLSQGLTGPLSQILLGFLGAGTAGLAIGYVIGQSSGTSLLISRAISRSWLQLPTTSWRGMARTAVRYAHFPLYASWARLLDMTGSGAILFLLYSVLYSGEIAGYMFLAERVIARPLLIVSTSLLQVFTGEAGRTVRQDPATLRRRFRQIVPIQSAFALSWILLANILAGWAFPILFGERWLAAVPYVRASSLSYLALTVLHPVSTSLQLMEHQRLAVIWQIARLILVVGSVTAAWQFGLSGLTALWLSSIAQSISCLTMLMLIATMIERIQRP